jgi:hypothetical protein
LVNEVNDQNLTGVENKLGDASLFTAASAKTSAAMKDTQTWHAMVFISLERSTDWDFHPIKESHTHTSQEWIIK